MEQAVFKKFWKSYGTPTIVFAIIGTLLSVAYSLADDKVEAVDQCVKSHIDRAQAKFDKHDNRLNFIERSKADNTTLMEMIRSQSKQIENNGRKFEKLQKTLIVVLQKRNSL